MRAKSTDQDEESQESKQKLVDVGNLPVFVDLN